VPPATTTAPLLLVFSEARHKHTHVHSNMSGLHCAFACHMHVTTVLLLMWLLMLLLSLQIVPADLNAFLYQMESNIAWAADLLSETDTAQRFEAAARERRNSINLLLWDNEAGGSGGGIRVWG